MQICSFKLRTIYIILGDIQPKVKLHKCLEFYYNSIFALTFILTELYHFMFSEFRFHKTIFKDLIKNKNNYAISEATFQH